MKVHKTNILKSTLVAAVSTLAAVSSPTFAATLTNGDFELGTIGGPNAPLFQVVNPGDNTTITGWEAIGGGILGGAVYQGQGLFRNNGVLSRTVQLNANNQQGGISTIISGLAQNDTVNVFFNLSGNLGAVGPKVSVALQSAGDAQQFCLGGNLNSCQNPTTIGPVVLPVNLAFQTFVASFVYTGTSETARLSFISLTGTNLGPIIDNVSLTPIPFEFSPVTGFIAGGVLFGSYKLIKRKKSVA